MGDCSPFWHSTALRYVEIAQLCGLITSSGFIAGGIIGFGGSEGLDADLLKRPTAATWEEMRTMLVFYQEPGHAESVEPHCQALFGIFRPFGKETEKIAKSS
jgi:hypothetical protein